MFNTVSAQAQTLFNRTSEIVIQAILLATVFFSGAFVDLQTLHGSVRLISWTLPATYGISLLQNIMLRGSTADPMLLLGLTVFGVGLFIVALLLLQRRMSSS